MYSITSSSLSEIGRVRQMNEDAVLERSSLYAVADGMGGHQAGEVASNLALSVLEQYVEDHLGMVAGEKLVANAIEAANAAVYKKANESSKYRSMGTTMTALYREGDTAYIAHVGDSRAYLFREGRLKRLSVDHSLVAKLVEDGEITEEQARTHPQRNIILKALGLEPSVEADVSAVEIKPGDEFLLASDGLMSEVEDAEIERTLAIVAEPKEQARGLADLALEAGGRDNVSVVLAKFDVSKSVVPAKVSHPAAGYDEEEAISPERRSGRRKKIAIVTVIIIFILLAGAVAGGFVVYNRSYFVGAKNGKVVLYKGFPFWDLAIVVKTTKTDVILLPAATQAKVNGNMEVETRSDAEKTLKSIQKEAEDSRLVPNVMGMTWTEAKKVLQDAGLKARSKLVPLSSAKQNTVIHQDPAASKRVGKGTTVNLDVAVEGKQKGV